MPHSVPSARAAHTPTLHKHGPRPFKLIGELINNSFARAAKAFKNRDVKAYQHLILRQQELGADYVTLNIDGTQTMMVRPQEMFDFLPDLIPAIQEVSSIPIAFDNPSIEFHKRCLKIFDPKKSGQPILNSVAASRTHLDEMLELVKHYDTKVIGMASEKFNKDGSSGQCLNADDVYGASVQLMEMLATKAGRRPEQVIIDPGLAPVGADTYGLVNMGLDAMRRIRANPSMKGIHISVGLTNFSFGMPKPMREKVESAYLTIAVEAGLDFVLGNPEKDLRLLARNDPVVKGIEAALECGRPGAGETQEEAGFRQAAKIIEMFADHAE